MEPPAFPPPHPNDSDDVAWALCTAAALWKQGRFDDAVPWVQKAAAAAAEGAAHGSPDSNVRVVQLTIAATELAAFVDSWRAGADLDPASVAISVDFDVSSIDVQSIPASQIAVAPPIPRVAPPPLPPPRLGGVVLPVSPRALGAPPGLKPRERTFAGTLPQEARSPLPKAAAKVAPAQPKPAEPGPNATLPAGRVSPRIVSTTLSTSAPSTPSTTTRTGTQPAPVAKDPFSGLDEARWSSGTMPAGGTLPAGAASQPVTVVAPDVEAARGPAVTKRMEDVPTRRIEEGEAWPAADLEERDLVRSDAQRAERVSSSDAQSPKKKQP